MRLLFINADSTTGTYFGASGQSDDGPPEFINLDNVLWGTAYRGSSVLQLTLVNGGTWQLKYSDPAAYRDAAKLFYLSRYDAGETQ